MFSYFEIFLCGRHLHLRSSGSFPFSSPFPSSLNQPESSFSSRLVKHYKSNQEYLRLLKNKQGIVIPSGKPGQIKARVWMADLESTSAAEKQKPSHMDAKSIADINQNYCIGEGLG